MASIDASQALSYSVDAIHYSRRAPPTAPTGYYDWEVSSNAADAKEGHSLVSNLVTRVDNFKAKGPIKPDPKAVVSSTTKYSRLSNAPTPTHRVHSWTLS